jgi:hypothetical protein
MTRHRPPGIATWLLAAAALWGCVGEVGGGGTPPGDMTTPPGTGPVKPTPGTGMAGVGPVGNFEPPKAQIKLLPFSVRMARIATVTGVPLTDPAYNTLKDNHLLLGDHDYANAKPPQESWSAARLATWVESVRPICQTPAVQTRYSPMPAKLPALVDAAYGRAMIAEDTAALNDGVKGLNVAPAKLVETTCIAVLSSLEFVAQ